MPKRIMRIEKEIEKEYIAKGYTPDQARNIGYGTITKKFGWHKGQH